MKAIDGGPASLHKGLLVLVLVAAQCLAGEVSVTTTHGLLDLSASNAPLEAVLASVADAVDLDIYSAIALDRRVSAELRQVGVARLVRRLLRGESYLLVNARGRYTLLIHARDADGARIVIAGNRASASMAWRRALEDLQDADRSRRADAVYDLADAGGLASADLARHALGDPDAEVRLAAVEVLAELDAVAILAERWTDLPADTQIDVIDAAGDVVSPSSTAFLEAIAEGGETRFAAAAAAYLAERRRPIRVRSTVQ